MIAHSEFQHYLQRICSCSDYEQWWAHGVLTNTEREQSEPFDFDLHIKEVKPRQDRGTSSENSCDLDPPLPVIQALHQYVANTNHVLLVGRPGAGKTKTLIRYLLKLAKQALDDPSAKIPILVQLKDYKVPSDDYSGIVHLIRKDLEETWELSLKLEEIQRYLFQDRIFLLLVDGLNELSASQEAQKDIRLFRDRCHKRQIPIVFVTRSLGYRDLGVETQLEIQPISAADRQRFIEKRVSAGNRQKLQGWLNRARQADYTPFVMWMLATVCQQVNSSSQLESFSLGEAFREFVRLYEDKLYEDGKISEEDCEKWSSRLEHLASEMMTDERAENFVIPRVTAIEIIGSEALLNNLVRYHLLVERQGKSEIEFCHQLLQEYYVAESLRRRLPDFLKDESSGKKFQRYYLNYLKWTEPIAIMLGLPEITENQAKQLIELALDVDLYLGARLAGEAALSQQQATVNVLLQKNFQPSLIIWLLEQTQSPNALPFLLDVLKNGCSDTRWRAARALDNFANTTVSRYLIEALKDGDSSVRHKAAESLGNLGDVEATLYLCQLLDDEDWLVRSIVVDVLGKLEGIAAINCLKIALKHQDYTVRTKAAEYLGQRVPQEVIPLLNEEFTSGNADTKRDILQLLGETKNAAALPILIQALSETDWIVRSEAVSQIGRLGLWLDESFSEDAVTTLIHILQYDPEASIRSSAALHLGYLANSRAVPVLIEVLSKEDNPVVRSAAAEALGRLQDQSAISILTRSLQDEDYVSEAAIRALRTLNAVEALPVLRKLVNSQAVKVRREVIFTLGFLGDSKDLPSLYKALQDKEFSIRVYAAYSLSKLNNRKGVPILEDALKTGNKDAREVGLGGLQKFNGKVGLSSIIETAFKDDEHSIRKKAVEFIENFKESQEVVNQLKIALESLNEDICRNAMDAAKVLGNVEVLLRLRQIAETITVIERPLDAIAAIQSRCQFYNYEIFQSISLHKTPKTPIDILDIINQTTQATYKKINQMADQPKVQMNFHAPVENAVGNVEGDMIVNTAPSTREATTAISNLLSNLRQKYPNATDAEILDILTQSFNAMPQQNPQNWQRWKDLFSVLFAGSTEAIKIAKPEVGIPIEVLKRLYEIYDRHRKKLSGS